MKKNIYIAYTGGTIGMQSSKDGYVPVKNFFAKELEKIPDLKHSDMPNYYLYEYESLIDSSNMEPFHWQQIADDIKENYDNFDGFIILHGTDTMAYTASALSFLCQNLTKPIIITGSQIPLINLRTDGKENLLNSLYIAANHPIREVGLFFNNKLFRANRAMKFYADGFDAFTSPNFLELLRAGIHIKKIASPLEVKTKNPCFFKIIKQAISIVHIYPGIDFLIIKNMLKTSKALILLSYGVGNAPDQKELLETLKEATRKEILIMNLTQCVRGKVNMQGYATGKNLQNIGVISAKDMTIEATLAKLHFVLSQNLSFAEQKKMMQENIAGEMSD